MIYVGDKVQFGTFFDILENVINQLKIKIMCLYSKTDKATKATNDIKCYKVVYNVDSNKVHKTPYQATTIMGKILNSLWKLKLMTIRQLMKFLTICQTHTDFYMKGFHYQLNKIININQ